jgi:Sigma-70, region 4
MRKDFCENCRKRSTCTELCEKVEAWISKDYVSQREKTVSDIHYNNNDVPDVPDSQEGMAQATTAELAGIAGQQIRRRGGGEQQDSIGRCSRNPVDFCSMANPNSDVPTLHGRWVQKPITDFKSHSDMASYHAEPEVNFSFLSPLQNRCLQLFHFEGLTRNQIAIRVKKSRSSVKGHLERAREKIQAVFSKSEEEDILASAPELPAETNDADHLFFLALINQKNFDGGKMKSKKRKVWPLVMKIHESFNCQGDCAAAAGIHESELSRFINGRQELSDEKRARLARVLGCQSVGSGGLV